MKTQILIGLGAAFLFGAAETRAKDVSTTPETVKENSDAPTKQQDKSSGPSTDRKMPKSIACAQETGEVLGQCTYRIERDEKGKTTITVAFANGFKRRLFFKDGTFLKANTTMSGTGTDTDWNLKDGTHEIRVDDQRYEVPDILIEEN